MDADDIILDFESSALSIEDIEKAAQKATQNMGAPNQIFVSANSFFMMPQAGFRTWMPRPEFEGTEWAHFGRMSKRELAFAKLQIFLVKFGLQKHLQDDDVRRADCELVQRRLKRAKWARYQQRKSKRSPA